MRKLLLLFVIGTVFILSSCRKEAESSSLSNSTTTSNTTSSQPTKTEQLNVTSDFNWKTFKDVQLTLTGNANSIIEVASTNQTVYQRAYLAKDIPYTMKLSVPAYETSVHLLYLGKDVTIPLSSGILVYKFN